MKYSLENGIKLVYYTDKVNAFDFKRQVKKNVVDYSLPESIDIPDNVEVIACMAAAEGKSFQEKFEKQGFSLRWDIKDKLVNYVVNSCSYNEGLSKVWLVLTKANVAINLYNSCSKFYCTELLYINYIKQLDNV